MGTSAMLLRALLGLFFGVLVSFSPVAFTAAAMAQKATVSLEQLQSELNRARSPITDDQMRACSDALTELFEPEKITLSHSENSASDPFAVYPFPPLLCSVVYNADADAVAISATPRPKLKKLPSAPAGDGVLSVYSKRKTQVWASAKAPLRLKASWLSKIGGVPVLFEANPPSMAHAQAFIDFTKQFETKGIRVPKGWRKHIGSLRSVSQLKDGSGRYKFSLPGEPFLEGIISAEGTVIVSSDFDDVVPVKGGFIVRDDDGNDGVLSADGKSVLPVEYQTILDKGEGLLLTIDFDTNYRLFDAASQSFLTENYDEISFVKDEDLIEFERGGVHEFRNRDLEPAFEGQFSRVTQLPGPVFIVEADDVSWLIDKQGDALIAPEFESLWPHTKHRLIFARKGDDTAYFDYAGNQVSPKGWTVHYAPSDDKGHITVSAPDGRFGVIDKTGETVIPAIYAQVHQFSEGYLPAAQLAENGSPGRRRFGLIDEQGETVIPFEYDNLQLVRGGRLWARKNGKWGLIDTSEAVVADLNLDEISRFRKAWDPETREDLRLMIVKKDGLYGMVRHDTGEVIAPFEFAQARALTLELRKGGEWLSYPCIAKPELNQCKSKQNPGEAIIPSSRRPR